MEVIGTLKVKYDTQLVSDRFKKRELVLTTEANTPYPQHIIFQVTQDKCDILNAYDEGDEIKCQFNLRGREWSGPQGVKYFNTLEIWRVELVAKGTGMPNVNTGTHNTASQNTATSLNDNDDLPF